MIGPVRSGSESRIPARNHRERAADCAASLDSAFSETIPSHDLLEPHDVVVAQLWEPSALRFRETARVLDYQLDEEAGFLVRHVDDFIHLRAGGSETHQEIELGLELLAHRLGRPAVERLGHGCAIEVTIVPRRLAVDREGPIVAQLVVDQCAQWPGEALQGLVVFGASGEHDRRDGKDHSRRGEPRPREHVMDKPAVEASVPVPKRMYEDESEAGDGGRDHRVDCRSPHPIDAGDQPRHHRPDVLRLRANELDHPTPDVTAADVALRIAIAPVGVRGIDHDVLQLDELGLRKLVKARSMPERKDEALASLRIRFLPLEFPGGARFLCVEEVRRTLDRIFVVARDKASGLLIESLALRATKSVGLFHRGRELARAKEIFGDGVAAASIRQAREEALWIDERNVGHRLQIIEIEALLHEPLEEEPSSPRVLSGGTRPDVRGQRGPVHLREEGSKHLEVDTLVLEGEFEVVEDRRSRVILRGVDGRPATVFLNLATSSLRSEKGQRAGGQHCECFGFDQAGIAEHLAPWWNCQYWVDLFHSLQMDTITIMIINISFRTVRTKPPKQSDSHRFHQNYVRCFRNHHRCGARTPGSPPTGSPLHYPMLRVCPANQRTPTRRLCRTWPARLSLPSTGTEPRSKPAQDPIRPTAPAAVEDRSAGGTSGPVLRRRGRVPRRVWSSTIKAILGSSASLRA